MMKNILFGIIEISLGTIVLIVSFYNIVILGTLSLESEWYLRIFTWFSLVISFKLIDQGKKRFELK